jgi:DNA-directed RNA polymerase subunit RPC12/RpoP
MAIHIKCEHCGHILNVPDDMKGKKVRCPNCDKKTIATPEVDKQFVGTSAVSPAPSKYDSLRVMGKVFVFVGYLLAIVAIAFGLCAMVKVSDQGWTRDSLIAFLKYFIVALVIFVACKFQGELSRVLADIGDNDANILKLLRELSDQLSQPPKR